jgi:hypothetical protein
MRSVIKVGTAVLALVLPAGVQAQSVDEIVARHIEARGGMDKLKAVQTVKITRTVATPFNDVRVIIYKKRPSLFRAEQGPPDGKTPLSPRGINADAAWDTVANGRVTLRQAAAAAETRDLDGDFDGLLVGWKEKGHTVTYEGRETLPIGDVHKLRVKTKGGAERVIHLDATTYLDRRHTGVLTLPNGSQFNIIQDYGNWKEVNGVKFPFDISEERTGKQPVQSLVTYTEKIEVNVPMDESLFAAPAGTGG